MRKESTCVHRDLESHSREPWSAGSERGESRSDTRPCKPSNREQEEEEAMKTSLRVMLAIVMLGAAGCAGGVGPATTTPTVDISGRWVGTWVATTAALGNGQIEMTVKQTGTAYSGNLLVTGSPTDPSGPTEGVVSGNQVRVMRPTNLTGSLTA